VSAPSDFPALHVGQYQFMPKMEPGQFEALKADIASRGVVTPIDIDENGAILDGHNRYLAWCELQRNEPPPTIVRAGLSEDEKRSFAIRQNVHRRHLSREQIRGLIARELRERPACSNRVIAADVGVDHKTVGAIRRALNSTGELPQLEATIGADGKTRRAKASAEVSAWAKAFGGKVGGDDLPDDVGLAFFKAGIPANTIISMPAVAFPTPQLSEEHERDWELYRRLLEEKLGWGEEGIEEHLHWVICHHGYKSPDEWLGPDGAGFRKRCRMREPSDEFKGWWRDLKTGAHL